MAWKMRISDHIYNFSEYGEGHEYFKEKAQAINRENSQPRFRYASGVTRQKIQKVWQTQLSLCRAARSRELLPFCQCTKQESHYGLCFSQKQRHGRKSLGELPKSSKNYGRNQHHQPRSVSSQGNTIERKLWTWKWKPPP
jgi:hypothetical protein